MNAQAGVSMLLAGHRSAIRQILSEGIDPNTVSMMARGVAPLHWAAMRGLAGECRKLIGAGADLEVAEPLLGRTPLLWAASRGHDKVCEALVDAGADLGARDVAGCGIWHWGASHPRVRFWLLAAGADPNVADRAGATPLHHAASYGTSMACEALLAAGAEINRPDRDGATPLDRARENEAFSEDAAAILGVLEAKGARPGARLQRRPGPEEAPAPTP